jgi:hypothetical protein
MCVKEHASGYEADAEESFLKEGRRHTCHWEVGTGGIGVQVAWEAEVRRSRMAAKTALHSLRPGRVT